MKKILLLIITLSALSCSSDSQDDVSDSSKTQSLEGAILTPQNSRVIGYGQTIQYELRKGDKLLNSYDYTWTIADTLVAQGRDAFFTSRLIGETKITVSDDKGHSLDAAFVVLQKVGLGTWIPSLKWGATFEEVKSIANLGWVMTDAKTNSPVYQKGKYGIRFKIPASTGLTEMELIEDYRNSDLFGGGYTDGNLLLDYLNENYVKIGINEPHYYGYQRWWYNNEFNQRVYIDISGKNSDPVRYKLRFSRS